MVVMMISDNGKTEYGQELWGISAHDGGHRGDDGDYADDQWRSQRKMARKRMNITSQSSLEEELKLLAKIFLMSMNQDQSGRCTSEAWYQRTDSVVHGYEERDIIFIVEGTKANIYQWGVSNMPR